MPKRRTQRSSPPGFTLLELLIVVALAAIVGGIAVPTVGRSLAGLRVQRAANVVAAELQLASSTVARRRQPVQVVLDAPNRVMRVRSYPATTTVYTERRFDQTSAYAVQSMTTPGASSVILYPNGLASGTISVALTAGGQSLEVQMNRTGQVRIVEP